MGRAERRRLERHALQNNRTYTMTDAEIRRMKISAAEAALKNVKNSDAIVQIKEEIAADAVNTAMLLMLVLPMKVLMEDYWPKSFEKKVPGFIEKVLDYYNQWIDGKLDMEELKKELWEVGGVRLEETQ